MSSLNLLEILLGINGVNVTKRGDFLNHVQTLFHNSAFVNGYAMPHAAQPNRPIHDPADASAVIGIDISERVHRFQIHGVESTVGDTAAYLSFKWLFAPQYYYALPEQEPPPTRFDRMRSQRFTMQDTVFALDADGKHFFRGFGTGLTRPVIVDGERQLRFSAVGTVLAGFGLFEGFWGSYVLEGVLSDDYHTEHQFFLRFFDSDRKLIGTRDLASIQPTAVKPRPGTTFMMVLGQPDAAKGDAAVQQHFAGAQMTGATIYEDIELVDLDFTTGQDGQSLHTHWRPVGRKVAKFQTHLEFNPLDPRAPGTIEDPIVFGGRNTRVDFFDPYQQHIGSLLTDTIEGRGFTSYYPDSSPMPIFRLCGYGPLTKGTKAFENVQGVMSVNAAVCPWPVEFSNIYTFSFIDPDGKWQKVIQQLQD
jgi:hypothetical protein